MAVYLKTGAHKEIHQRKMETHGECAARLVPSAEEYMERMALKKMYPSDMKQMVYKKPPSFYSVRKEGKDA
jgi:hypothetical protein